MSWDLKWFIASQLSALIGWVGGYYVGQERGRG